MTFVILFTISSVLPLWFTQPPILLVSESFLQLTYIHRRRLRKTGTVRVLPQEGQVGHRASLSPSQSNHSDFITSYPSHPQMEAITCSPCYRPVIPRNSEVGTQSGAGQEIGGVERGVGVDLEGSRVRRGSYWETGLTPASVAAPVCKAWPENRDSLRTKTGCSFGTSKA